MNTLIGLLKSWLARHKRNEDPCRLPFRRANYSMKSIFGRLIALDFHFQPTKVRWFISYRLVCGARSSLGRDDVRMLKDFNYNNKKEAHKNEMKCNKLNKWAKEEERQREGWTNAIHAILARTTCLVPPWLSSFARWVNGRKQPKKKRGLVDPGISH